MESVIFTTPVIFMGFILALALMVTCFFKKMHWLVLAASMLIFIAAASYAALLGATLGEVGTMSMIFFLISAVTYIRRRDGK